MPMFYVAWSEDDARPGFVCEALDVPMALRAAEQEEPDAKPVGVRMLPPCTFGARVHFSIPDGQDLEEVEVEPCDHTVEDIGKADDAIAEAVEAAKATTEPAPPELVGGSYREPALRLVNCKATATDPKTGHEVRCTKPDDGHGDGKHRAGKLGW